MKRPSEKLLRDMTSVELTAESEWHRQEASKLFEKVAVMRSHALEVSEQVSEEILQSAAAIEAEAGAHMHQSNLLTTLRASRLREEGVGEVERAAGV